MQKDIIKKIIFKRIKKIEQEIRETPYHKGTEHHIGLLKAKAAKLRRELGETDSKASGGGGGYGIKQQGDASCVLIGPPSAGKSTLLNVLTSAQSKIGAYDFTTLNVIPGMMFYQGAQIQIFDLPGLVVGAAQGKGGGKKILSTVRGSDLIILVSSPSTLKLMRLIKKELSHAGLRLDETAPKIRVKKQFGGGIRIIDPFTSFDKETIRQIVVEFGLKNAEIIIGQRLESIDQLIDVLADNRVYLPSLEVITKADLIKDKDKFKDKLVVSAEEKTGLNQLKKAIWQKLELIRVYLKDAKARPADYKEPLILKKGSSVADAASVISSELLDQIKDALIWGPGAKFPGQKVPLKYLLQDETELFFSV